MSELLRFATDNARREFRPPTNSVFDIEPVTYATTRIEECAQDLLDAVMGATKIETVLRVEAIASELIVKFAALSETSLLRAVKLTHTEGT